MMLGKNDKTVKVKWYHPKVIKQKIGEFVERSGAIKSRLTIMRTPEGNIISRLVARTPRNAKLARNYKYFNIPYPDDTPMCVTGDDRAFFWLIQKNTLKFMVDPAEFEWFAVDGDLYEFMLRMISALVNHERLKNKKGEPVGAKIHLEMREVELVPTTDVRRESARA